MKRRCFIWVMVLIGSSVLHADERPSPSDLQRAANSLDKVAKQLEYYGNISLSTPLLIPALKEKDQPFGFDLHKPGEFYFNEAKSSVQGSLSVEDEVRRTLSIAAAFRNDPTQVAAYESALARRKTANDDLTRRNSDLEAAAKHEYETSLDLVEKEADPTKRIELLNQATDKYEARLQAIKPADEADPTSTDYPAPKADATTDHATASTWATIDQTSGQSTITNRSAIITAAGDNAVEGIFRALGNPGKAVDFDSLTPFFGVTMVSVTPGSKTRSNFFADVTMVTELEIYEPEFSNATDVFESIAKLINEMIEPEEKERAEVAFEQLVEDYTNRIAHTVNIPSLGVTFGPLARELRARIAKEGTRSLRLRTEQLYEALPKTVQGGHIQKLNGALTIDDGSKLTSERPLTFRAPPHLAPNVAAVSPMTESQVLDLASSYRSQTEVALDLALALAKAGSSESASVFARYARDLEGKAQSRLPQNLVTGYSSGQIVGYQVGPGFAALGDLGGRSSKAGQILQRQSFPALMIFGFQPNIVRSKVYLDLSNGATLRILKPRLALRQYSRWIPYKSGLFHWRRLSEKDRNQSAYALSAARKVVSGNECRADSTCAALSDRVDLYSKLTGAQYTVLPLPAPRLSGNLRLSGWTPSVFQLQSADAGGKVDVVLRGEGLAALSEPTLVGGGEIVSKTSYTSAGPTAGVLTFELTGKKDGKFFVQLSSIDQLTHLSAGPFEVKAAPKAVEKKMPANELVLRYEVKQSSTGSEHTVYADAKPTGKMLEFLSKQSTELMKAQIQKDLPKSTVETPGVKVSVETEGKK